MTLLNAFQERLTSNGRMMAWVTSSSQNPTLGILQPGAYVARAHVHVTEAFDSDGTDTLTVGYSTDTDAFVTSVDVSTTGVKSITLGILSGFNSTARTVKAYYVNGGSSPATGKALVILEILSSPPQP
jgi:hypothetical protein